MSPIAGTEIVFFKIHNTLEKMRKGDKEKSKKGKKNSGREWPKKEGAKVNELYHKIKKKKENEEQ